MAPKLTSAALLLSAMIAQTHAAPAAAELTTITLMGESLPETAIPAAATRLSILGVNENGGTTYVQELEYTDMISMTLSGSLVSGSDSNPTWVRTGEQVGEPYETTITQTFVQDATHWAAEYSDTQGSATNSVDPTAAPSPTFPPGWRVDRHCDFVGSTQAVCVAVLQAPSGVVQDGVTLSLEPATQTDTVSAAPWATIEVGEGGSVRVLGGGSGEEGGEGSEDDEENQDGQEGAAVSMTPRGSLFLAAATLLFVAVL